MAEFDVPAEYRAIQAEKEVQRLMELIEKSDVISPCACCGVKLAWVYLGDGASHREVLTGEEHKCSVSSEQFARGEFPNGTYRYMEHRAKTMEAMFPCIQAACGMPDPAEACRVILELCKKKPE